MESKLPLPQGCVVEQRFERPTIADLTVAVRSELASLALADQIRPGQTVAIAVGSRGIRGIDAIIKGVVDEMKALERQTRAGGGPLFIRKRFGTTRRNLAATDRGFDSLRLRRARDQTGCRAELQAHVVLDLQLRARVVPETHFVDQASPVLEVVELP